jgi:hypothetical protein
MITIVLGAELPSSCPGGADTQLPDVQASQRPLADQSHE